MKICDLLPNKMTGSRFHIKPENILAAYEAAKNTCDVFEGMDTLTELFDHLGFTAEIGVNGIDELYYNGNYYIETIDIINFFDVIAPFVEGGSYIEMMGTEGGPWRWVFNGKEMTGQLPVDFIWPSQPLEENYFLGFTHSSRQNYWDNIKQYNDYCDEVIFGIHDKRGGVACELIMRWHELNGKQCPCFNAFISDIPPMETQALLQVIQSAMDYGDKLTPKDFCKCLMWLGYKDLSDKPLE